MGPQCSREVSTTRALVASQDAPVVVNVYDIGENGSGLLLNELLGPFGTGVFHCGVEVYGQEWSFSSIGDGFLSASMTGVFSSLPRKCVGHLYRKSVPMGRTTMFKDGVDELIRLMAREWPVNGYDLLRRNCCHFSNELCLELGVGPIPQWILHLAGAAAAIAEGNFGDVTCCRVAAGGPCCAGDAECCEVALRHHFRELVTESRSAFDEEIICRPVRCPSYSSSPPALSALAVADAYEKL
mmetsp:Transcript_123293/g.356253  ORF Transcript_123293/g.356253 Transcript_123293/m.356253 type:complete len:241 (-) Transcript_123293:39-761(-)